MSIKLFLKINKNFQMPHQNKFTSPEDLNAIIIKDCLKSIPNPNLFIFSSIAAKSFQSPDEFISVRKITFSKIKIAPTDSVKDDNFCRKS